MRTRMLMVAVALLLAAGCGSNSPTDPSVSAPERPALDAGGAIGSGNATDPAAQRGEVRWLDGKRALIPRH